MSRQPPPSTAIVQATAPTDPKQQLITAIRGWVHMDNLAESFNRQATNARALRAKHETEAIALMKKLGLQGSQIQISGGATLQLAQKKAPANLTWGYLEREVPAWATRAGLSATQSAALIKWLQEHREMRETEYLKKAGPKGNDPEVE